MDCMSGNHDRDNLRELSEALRNLDILQIRLNQVTTNNTAQRERTHPPRQINRSREFNIRNEGDLPLLSNSTIRLGDRVWILNPSPGQQAGGIVTGTTRNGDFIWVRTANGRAIRMTARNLRVISSH